MEEKLLQAIEGLRNEIRVLTGLILSEKERRERLARMLRDEWNEEEEE